VLFPRLWKRELERIFTDRYGITLPDDSAGEAFGLLAGHLMQFGKHYVAAWASLWAPWLSDEATEALIEPVDAGKYWTAAALAKELNLNDATRARLKIRTIGAVDSTEAQRIERRNKIAKRNATRAVLRVLRPAPASVTKPWLAFGQSERW
jgi:hypothetical protein